MAPAPYTDILKNISLKLTKQGTLQVDEVAMPKCMPNEILVHVKCTGVCGSDIHLWKEGGIGDLRVTEDLILGHEFSGQVVFVGLEVKKSLKVGDKVAIEPQLPCGWCFLCQSGDYNLCLDVDFMGVPGMPGRDPSIHGSMQRYKAINPQYAHKMPRSMTYPEGALVEVFSVGYHGIEKAGGLDLGKPTMIAGCGPIGLATLMLADNAGSYPIVVSDISKERLEFSRKLVPSVITYQVQPKLSVQENAREIRKLFGTEEWEMPPYVLECTGVESSINTCCYVTRRAGTLTVLGVSGKKDLNNFPFMHLSFAEIDLRFINRYKASWPPVINLLSSGKIDATRFVSHSFPLEKANEALETVANPLIQTVKVVVEDKD